MLGQPWRHAGAEPLQQSDEEPTDPPALAAHIFGARGNKPAVNRKLEVPAELVRLREGDAQATNELRPGTQSVPFGDIGRYRASGSSDLIGEAEVVAQRFSHREQVRVARQVPGAGPCVEGTKTIHEHTVTSAPTRQVIILARPASERCAA